MRGTQLILGFVLLLGLGALSQCVSRTLPDARFSESRSLQSGVVPPVLADGQNYSFAAVGDVHVAGGDTQRLRRILSAATAEGDSFVILLGDIADAGEATDVAAYHAAIQETGWAGKVYTVIGNHDIFGNGWTTFRDANGPSHFSFTAGNAKFIALDTADGTIGAEQAAWLRGELGPGRPTHTFLLSHYLPVVPGRRTYLKLANEIEALRLMKLATQTGVRGWLGAHYHSYLRDTIEGVDYVVAGGGGGRRMDPVRDFFYVQVVVQDAKVTYQMKKVD